MSDKRNPHIERYTRRFTAKVMHICLHIAFFFGLATLFSFYFLNDLLLTQAVKPEYASWLTVELQSQLKFAILCLCKLFFVFGLSSLSVTSWLMASYYISQMTKKVKNKFTKIPN
ncbi:hypothetical protein NTP67_21805 (plasmid) [Providencia rettgeri]|uniref:hypothetical protein n=1 Tax=Providencia rettgeri TaxID=587 RepID=UPI00221FFA48|nr:hypothetical protein [Providencia rettgeri]EMA4784500.1 hypothetical protein [Providencia rettgeri]EMB3084046.1 hypothetical protein [Providencia rettgeri]EMB3084539.1 hypothetical protein [Providencia rettgeri]MDU7496163.1 hypothetical protein [Providencia rettgeri]UYV43804.1 hypothetical protein NTP67_21805 [Providencia rettgeri]